MSVFRKFCYYSRWQYCHLGHTTCSIFRNYSLCLVAWKWFCYWKDCNKVSAHAKLFSTVLQKNFFSHGKLPRSFGQQPNFPFIRLLKKIFNTLIFGWAQSQPRFMLNGSYACYCKTLVVWYFSFEFDNLWIEMLCSWSTIFVSLVGNILRLISTVSI